MGDVSMEPDLRQVEALPAGLLPAAAHELDEVLGGPTLIHLPGRHAPPLFVSVLLHGNEPTGWDAVRQVLAKYRDTLLPRALSLFVGNVAAARFAARRLDGQVDYNRIWPCGEGTASAEGRMAESVLQEMQRRGVFASVDVHNNTGTNPHYACVNRLDHRSLRLATLFGRLVIHFTRPTGTQAAAFASFCPAVTLECGKPGHPYGVEHAAQFLDACLHLTELPDHPVPAHDIDLFRSVAQVTVREEIPFSFDSTDCGLRLLGELDHQNFTEMPAGFVWGHMPEGRDICPVLARDEAGRDVTREYFEVRGARLLARKRVMPSMLTLDERVIRQDCLCYLMERVEI